MHFDQNCLGQQGKKIFKMVDTHAHMSRIELSIYRKALVMFCIYCYLVGNKMYKGSNYVLVLI